VTAHSGGALLLMGGLWFSTASPMWNSDVWVVLVVRVGLMERVRCGQAYTLGDVFQMKVDLCEGRFGPGVRPLPVGFDG